jgi:hypothetical protein
MGKSKKRIILILFILAFYKVGFSQKAHYFDSTHNFIDNRNPNVNIEPGDTIYLLPGKRYNIAFRDIVGTKTKPIIITNKDGRVVIGDSSFVGISFQYCSFIKLSGKGEKGIEYGIKIAQVARGSGIGIDLKSTDFELEFLEIARTKYAGIVAKTDVSKDFSACRDSFLMKNISIHDCYLHHIGNEGMYIGSTKYTVGEKVNINGKEERVLPHLIKGLKVYNNTLEHIGWDGLQICSATEDCQIYNNKIIYDSEEMVYNQMSGIMLGSGSKCDCYNNFILDGNGSGIEIFGLGGFKVYNNIIINPGKLYYPSDVRKMRYGIFVDHRDTYKDSSIHLINNTIISPKSDGIRFMNKYTRNSKLYNNLIINPGNYDYYENGGFSVKGIDAYIYTYFDSVEVDTSHNYFSRQLDGVIRFIPYQYRIEIVDNSPVIDNGINLKSFGILKDYDGYERPVGNGFDIGANEYQGNSSILQKKNQNEFLVFPNPATDYVIIENLTDKKVNSLCLISARGKLLTKKDNFSGRCKLNLLNQQSGSMYLIISVEGCENKVYLITKQ